MVNQIMEYDLELLMNSQNNNGIHIGHSESSSSSSVSSSDNTFLHLFNVPPCVSPLATHHQTKQHNAISPRNYRAETNQIEMLGNGTMLSGNVTNQTSMPNSCSLIFSTAASFNINQQVISIFLD